MDIPYSQLSIDHDSLVDYTVITAGGESIGPVGDILHGVANDNLIVKGVSGDILIPLITDVVLTIDTETARITIEAIDGLLDLNVKKSQ